MGNNRRYGGKKVKRALGAIWKDVRRDVSAEKRPKGGEAEELVALLDAYGPYVDPAWEKEWTACRQAIEKCLDLALNGDPGEVSRLMDSIEEMEKGCHRRHKD